MAGVWRYLRTIAGFQEYDIPEEELEELRMTSTLEPEEICRLKRAFFVYTDGDDKMTKAMFMDIPCIRVNPLKDRMALCFGFEKGVQSLGFPGFLLGVSHFNSHGRKEDKLKLAFRLQDFDDDNKLTKPDMVRYLETITGQNSNSKVAGWDDKAIVDVVDNVFQELASDDKKEVIELQDFIRGMHSSDFHTKLQLPL